MINAYKNERDLYSTLASSIFNKPYEECGDGTKERKACKTILLAIMYGVSAKGVADSIGISTEEATAIIDDFYKKHPNVKAWMTEMLRRARKDYFIEIAGGRKRRLPDINASDKFERLRQERQTINSMVQGAAAIQTKISMIKMYELCLKKGWKLLFSIHDEIAVLAPENLTREDVKEFEDVMLYSVKLAVPNKTDLEISTRWGCGVKVEDYFKN